MSLFDQEGYEWRETYFVYFSLARRPSMKQVQRLLKHVKDHFKLTSSCEDEQGGFESITVLAPSDYAAVDISLVEGEEVHEQGAALYEEMLPGISSPEEKARLNQLKTLDARFDLLHFEQISCDREEGLLDPSALLLILDALVKLTDGVGVDPQSGSLL